jgi:hypothetical protein
MISSSLQANNGGSLEVCGLSIVLVRKRTVLVWEWATLKSMADWIEFQGSGERMRSELLNRLRRNILQVEPHNV